MPVISWVWLISFSFGLFKGGYGMIRPEDPLSKSLKQETNTTNSRTRECIAPVYPH